MRHTQVVREQTDDEKKDAEFQNRMFTEYSIRFDDKKIKGDLEKALLLNFGADKNNIPEAEREKIRTDFGIITIFT